jgi:hypothetical protein
MSQVAITCQASDEASLREWLEHFRANTEGSFTVSAPAGRGLNRTLTVSIDVGHLSDIRGWLDMWASHGHGSSGGRSLKVEVS